MKCEICEVSNTKDNPVTKDINPYDAEINDIEIEMWMCQSCYGDSMNDI